MENTCDKSHPLNIDPTQIKRGDINTTNLVILSKIQEPKAMKCGCLRFVDVNGRNVYYKLNK